MKIPAIVLACSLAFSQAHAADDPFGQKVGPTEPVPPAEPPSAPPPEPPRADLPPPPSLTALGSMQKNLVAWFSLDDRERGGLAWSAQPIAATLSPSVAPMETGGHKGMDFSAEGAVLKLTLPLSLGKRYALATWAAFPVQNKHAAILFRGASDDLLNVASAGHFACYIGRMKDHVYAFGSAPAPKTGWHHLVLSVDGQQSTLYVDGRKYGIVPYVIAQDLLTIGNHPDKAHQGNVMAGGMDDVLIFNRELTEGEAAKLAKIQLSAP